MISFVKYFAPWGWIIGTSDSIDDFEIDFQYRIDAVIENLNSTIAEQRIGESGYFFIFDEEDIVLVHPFLAGTSISHLLNPETGNKITDDFREAASKPDPILEYTWDKPSHIGEYRFPKEPTSRTTSRCTGISEVRFT